MDGRIEGGAFVSRLMLYAVTGGTGIAVQGAIEMFFAVTGGTGIAVQGAKWSFARARGERASTGRRMILIVVRIDTVLVLEVITKGRSSC